MANKVRERRASVSQQTLDILQRGYYAAPDGSVQSIAVGQREAVAGSRHYRPEQLGTIDASVRARLQAGPSRDIRFEVTGETTLAAARRLVARGVDDPVCLNFASARNPGGGFLKGSSGQEESLARASGLYPCIAQMEAMYRHNRSNRSLLYSDHMIHSPGVPVFRADDNTLLPEPFRASFITAPAVNAGAVQAKQRRDRAKTPGVMRERIAKVLALAAHHNHRVLVLGAWGCGVFQNSPAAIASYFAEHLLHEGGAFTSAFERVTFAIVDASKRRETIAAFEQAFRGGLPVRD